MLRGAIQIPLRKGEDEGMLLQQVDRVEITILLDNVTDMLIRSSPHATRASFFKGPLRAEHGARALEEEIILKP
jgi:hypothetical protein